MTDLKKWWEDNGKLGQNDAEKLYYKQGKPCGNFLKLEFRHKIAEFRGYVSTAKPKKKCKIVQLTDLHIPFHDRDTLKTVFKFLEEFKPDQVILTGDVLDFYKLSNFDKDPHRLTTIQDEIDTAYPVLKRLTELCQEVHFIKGNHEDRLIRYLKRNPELASIKVLEIPKLLNLDTLRIHYHPYEYIYNDFRFTHGEFVRPDSGLSAKAEALKYGSNTSSGHTHRLGSYLKTDARGTIGAYEMGCLCELDPEYINGVPNWQQGFGVFHFDDNRFFCQQIPIIKHEFIYGNKRYK